MSLAIATKQTRIANKLHAQLLGRSSPAAPATCSVCVAPAAGALAKKIPNS
jgi:hypothetical protein